MPSRRGSYSQPASTNTHQATSGAISTTPKPQRMSPRKTNSRRSCGELATVSAPLVENGLASTTEDEIESAMMSPTAPTDRS
jgi:hypothetical protein